MRSMFRPWAQRTQDPECPLQSNEDDPELLITIPFNGTVKIKAICLIGQPSQCSLRSATGCMASCKCICLACSYQADASGFPWPARGPVWLTLAVQAVHFASPQASLLPVAAGVYGGRALVNSCPEHPASLYPACHRWQQ